MKELFHLVSKLHMTGTETLTPSALVEEMLDRLPAEIWQDPTKTFLDPAMGTGTFYLCLLQRLDRGLEGVIPDRGERLRHIMSRQLFGSEIDRKQLRRFEASLRHLGLEQHVRNVYNFDSMQHEWNMKFDVVVGNPPYQETADGERKDQASNLWTKFWWLSFKLVDPSGHIALLTPTSWLSPSLDLRGMYKIDGKKRLWDVFESYDSISRVTDVDKYFPNTGSTFGWVMVNVRHHSGTGGLRFIEGYDSSLGFLPKNNIDSVKKLIDYDNNLSSRFRIDQDNRNALRVCAPLTRKVTVDSVQILRDHNAPTGGSKNHKLFLYVYVDSEQEAVSVRNTIINAAQILNSDCRWSGFMNGKIFGMLRLQP